MCFLQSGHPPFRSLCLLFDAFIAVVLYMFCILIVLFDARTPQMRSSQMAFSCLYSTAMTQKSKFG